MSFDITFDYRFDSSGFFNDPARRAALEAAADAFESIITDDFADLPAGLQFQILNPSNGVTEETVTLDNPVDDLIIFVGARSLSGLGVAGPDGYSAAGDAYRVRIATDFRGNGPTTDFEPWAGTVAFDPNEAWNFDLNGPADGLNDFISVAIHEIAHVLGFGTSPAFDANVSGGNFVGPNTIAANNGNPVPLEPDASHVQEGFLGGTIALDPTLTVGNRKLLTDIDKAILADIGYQIAGFTAQGSQPAIATEGGETIFGTNQDDDINGLGGNDQLQGGGGNDTLRGGGGVDNLFGQAGTDAFVLGLGDGENRVNDFDLSSERIILLDSNFATPQAAAAAVTKPFSNVSRITLNDGSFLEVFHDSQSGTPLAASHFELRSPDTATPGADVLVGDAQGNVLDGLAGNDTLTGGGGNDTIVGGDGVDVALYSGDQASYTLTISPTELMLQDRRANGDGTDVLRELEFLDFETELPGFNNQPFELQKFAGQAGLTPEDFESFIELYIAYFNRAPDAIGLSFWGTAFATGTSLPEIAALFIDQDETRSTYPDTLTNAEFATAVYNNVLGRIPDQLGFDFWVGNLDRGDVGRDQFILEILAGAKAPPAPDAAQEFIDQQLLDQQFLADKTDIGAYFAVHRGLSDVMDAAAVMNLFDGSQSSITAAIAQVDQVYAAALDPDTGAFLMPLIGVLDDPFTA